MQPQSEELYQLYIQVLMQQNQHKQALEVYASYETMLYKESGQKPSESLQTLYREIIKELNNMHADISTSKMTCARQMQETALTTARTISLKICTVCLPEAFPEPVSRFICCCLPFRIPEANCRHPKRLNASMRSLQLAIGKSLRKGDVIPSTAEPSMW